MKKVLFIIVAMVLLSGAAWGQPKDALIVGGKIKSGVTINAPDPTAWKQFGSIEKFCEDKCSVKRSDRLITVYGECEQECLRQHRQKEPWAESRYRLEKNEVTGKCRVTEFRDNRWKPAHGLDIFGGRPCDEALDALEKYRQSEREDRAWKPIK